jgi:hypothetical protein
MLFGVHVWANALVADRTKQSKSNKLTIIGDNLYWAPEFLFIDLPPAVAYPPRTYRLSALAIISRIRSIGITLKGDSKDDIGRKLVSYLGIPPAKTYLLIDLQRAC